MEVPRVCPVGITEIPPGFGQSPRRYPGLVRLGASAVLGAFLLVGTATTVLSLGAVCLTSDAVGAAAPLVR